MSGSVSFSWTLPPGPPLTEAQRALVVEALPLAPKVTRRLAAGDRLAQQYEEDLEGVAREGLIWAAQKYDPRRGSVWMSYAYGGALIRCRQWLRAMKLRETRELDQVLRVDGEQWRDSEEELTRLDVTPDPTPLADELLLRHQVLALVGALPAREQVAVRRYLDDTTLSEVGIARGLSREGVRRRELAGLQRLREQMGLVPPRQRAEPRAAPPDADERLRELLSDGTPRGARALAAATGFTKPTVYTKLRAWGAVQVGTDGSTALWTIPRKVA